MNNLNSTLNSTSSVSDAVLNKPSRSLFKRIRRLFLDEKENSIHSNSIVISNMPLCSFEDVIISRVLEDNIGSNCNSIVSSSTSSSSNFNCVGIGGGGGNAKKLTAASSSNNSNKIDVDERVQEDEKIEIDSYPENNDTNENDNSSIVKSNNCNSINSNIFGFKFKLLSKKATVRLLYDPSGINIGLYEHSNPLIPTDRILIEKNNDSSTSSSFCKVGNQSFLLSGEFLLKFKSVRDAVEFYRQLFNSADHINNSQEHFNSKQTGKRKAKTVDNFSERTEDASALQYFQFYGYLSQQQNMMQDYIRTATYQKAILSNLSDFRDKVVLDVGCGSGILSFFALQAGAKRIYAVEASSMAEHANTLVESNSVKSKIIILPGKIEEIDSINEEIDVIISEPMGYMLFNERMLETFLHAKKWFGSKGRGKMYPSKGDLHIVPFTDDALYLEQCNKANFWQQANFHGINLGKLHNPAMAEYFRQPIVDTFDIRICLSKSIRHRVDFETASEYDLHLIEIPLEFDMLETQFVHGLAFWFDVEFNGSDQTVWLSTSPLEPLTHWYQVRCLIETPILAKQGDVLRGMCRLIANKRQSYDVEIKLNLGNQSANNTLDLKNPFFRYTGQNPMPPPGHHSGAPSDQIWATADPTKQTILTNGVGAINNTIYVDGTSAVATAEYPSTFILPHGSQIIGSPTSQLPQGSNQPFNHLMMMNSSAVNFIPNSIIPTAVNNTATIEYNNQHQHQHHTNSLNNSNNVGPGGDNNINLTATTMIGSYSSNNNVIPPTTTTVGGTQQNWMH